MYIRRTDGIGPEKFPANYNGNLRSGESKDANSEERDRCENRKFKIRKNASLLKKNERKNDECNDDKGLFTRLDNDSIILLGLIVFLYVGCEHTKDNMILIAILAYLLLGCQDAGE